MAESVWKFGAQVSDHLKVFMPRGAKPLYAEADTTGQSIWIWAQIETTSPMEWRGFKVYGTGHLLPVDTSERGRYFTTVRAESGFVWHLYELGAWNYETETREVLT